MIDVGMVREQVAGLLHAFEPDTVPLPEAVSLWETFQAIARDATAAATLLAPGVARGSGPAIDALIALADRYADSDEPQKRGPRCTTIVRADLEALRRGRVETGEVCEIAGIGAIPATTARELLGDSILKLVITKAVDVVNVTHLGRGPNAAQRIALFWSSDGRSIEGCARTRVEIDHRIPYAQTRHTRLDECDTLYKHHHDRKTYDGWALVEGTGNAGWCRPTTPDIPRTAHAKTRAESARRIAAPNHWSGERTDGKNALDARIRDRRQLHTDAHDGQAQSGQHQVARGDRRG